MSQVVIECRASSEEALPGRRKVKMRVPDNEKLRPNFAEWLREALKMLNLEPKALAARTGRSKSMISMLINGQRQPSEKMVRSISAALTEGKDDIVVNRTLRAALRARFPMRYTQASEPIPAATAAASLVREAFANYAESDDLSSDQLEILEEELFDFAYVRARSILKRSRL